MLACSASTGRAGGMDVHAILQSVLETAHKRNLNIFEILGAEVNDLLSLLEQVKPIPEV